MKQAVLAAAAALTVAVVPAQAGVLGMGDLAISQFVLIDTATGGAVTSFSIISDSRTGTAASDYNGAVGTGAGAGSITAGGGANVDVAYRCAGPQCGTAALTALYGGSIENNASTHIAPPAVANYSIGDMFINGSALTGGAQGLTRANASAIGSNNQGGASARIQNSASVTFTATSNITGAFSLNADAYVRAFVDAATPPQNSTFASGDVAWSITVRDLTAGTTVLQWTPNELNVGLFAATAAQSQVYSFLGNLVSPSAGLIAGHTYNLVIGHSSGATVSEIPEPGTLALVGVALLGVAGIARRRKA